MFDNLHPVFYLGKAVVPIMKSKSGYHLLQHGQRRTADRATAVDGPLHITKVGLLVLGRSLARLVAPYGITVNAISPGFIDSANAPEELEAAAKRIPAGYVGA